MAAMDRPIWQGAISFGLVQIPVGLYRAERPGEDLSFTLLDAEDHAPVGYRHVNKKTGEEVPKERRVKGYEVSKGQFVILDDEDFKRANVKASETIDILTFVPPSEIPVVRFERPYFIEPTERGAKAYKLLHDGLSETGKVGVATFVLRNRQHLCALLPVDGAIVLEILRFDDEIMATPDVPHPAITKAELAMAKMLIDGMNQPFSSLHVKDTYHADLLRLIEERAKHPEAIPEPLPTATAGRRGGDVVDIMSLLKKSVEEKVRRPHGKAHARQKRA